MILNYDISDDFIGVFDTDTDTSSFIRYWKHNYGMGCTINRGSEQRLKDTTLDLKYGSNIAGSSVHATVPYQIQSDSYHCSSQDSYDFVSTYNQVCRECVPLYLEKYRTVGGFKMIQTYLNVQRTLPSEGYHIWHCERENPTGNRRVLATMLYLNDVKEGGETEFLYQRRRIQPKRGRLVVWPSGFTHTHRGNPPLSEEKYIATSWIEFSE